MYKSKWTSINNGQEINNSVKCKTPQKSHVRSMRATEEAAIHSGQVAGLIKTTTQKSETIS